MFKFKKAKKEGAEEKAQPDKSVSQVKTETGAQVQKVASDNEVQDIVKNIFG